MKEKTEIQKLTEMLIKFRDARNWEQFHNSKDLALAISVEAAELNELFLWKRAEDVDVKKLQEELADILIFAFLLAAKHNLSIKDIMMDKIRVNEKKYPVEKARDTARKYNEL
jgi:NTP pyrophosphatase (non-canonical NTP hydrolase)